MPFIMRLLTLSAVAIILAAVGLWARGIAVPSHSSSITVKLPPARQLVRPGFKFGG
jgi:hypothetical protein